MKTERKHLTANQAMILLDIFVGTFAIPRHTGTAVQDVQRLINNGWVKWTGNDPELTDAGNALVKEWLD